MTELRDPCRRHRVLGVEPADRVGGAEPGRRDAHQQRIGVAKALALYQLGSATPDWVMWIVLADQNVFSTTLGQALVMISIPTHYTLGFLLVRAIRRASAAQAGARSPGAAVPGFRTRALRAGRGKIPIVRSVQILDARASSHLAPHGTHGSRPRHRHR